MKNKILRLKPWLLFTVTFAIGFLAHILLMIFIFLGIVFQEKLDFSSIPIAPIALVYSLILAISVFTFLYWMWHVTLELNKRLDIDLKIKLTSFKLSMIISIIYFICFALLSIIFLVNGAAIIGVLASPILIAALGIINLIMTLFLLHAIWITSKVFKTAELQKKIGISDHILDFILFWIYPVGVWFIQPKVITLLQEPENHGII